MNSREKDGMLASLLEGRGVLLDALEGVSEQLATRRPEPERWSVLEVVEHLALAEDYLFGRIEAAVPVESSTINRVREAAIVVRGADRSRPLPAPDVARPRGQFLTLADATESFLRIRDRTLGFVDTCADDLRMRVTDHPLIAGPVNCYEMLMMISVHPVRHAQQIAEIVEAVREQSRASGV